MKISIVIPVYNVEEYIAECLRSVIAQTYKGDMECIIVDDCGTDRSIDIARGIVDAYSGPIEFRIVSHGHNRGLSAARNTGTAESTGDYIYYLDSDDSIVPECIELMARGLAEHPDAEVVQAGAQSDNKWVDIETKDLPAYSNDRVWIKTTLLKRYVIPLTAWNKLIKRSFIDSHNLSFREGLIHEDELYNWMLAKYVSSIVFVRKNIYLYRTARAGSIMKSCSDRKEIMAWCEILEECVSSIDDFCVQEQLRYIIPKIHSFYFRPNTPELRKSLRRSAFRLAKIVPDLKSSFLLYTWSLPCFTGHRFVEHFFKTYRKGLDVEN